MLCWKVNLLAIPVVTIGCGQAEVNQSERASNKASEHTQQFESAKQDSQAEIKLLQPKGQNAPNLSLTHQVETLQVEVEHLTTDIQDLRQQLIAAQGAREHADRIKDDLATQLAKQKKEVEILIEEIALAKTSEKSMFEAKVTVHRQMQTVKEENRTLREEIAKLKRPDEE